jgi:CRISPR-associated protein Cas1
VHAAILSGGYSPALGFIHCGKQLSFVYDVADLYKADFTIPLAFATAAGAPTDIEREIRLACRDHFRHGRLMERILPDIQKVLDVPALAEDAEEDEFADDAAMPADLWQPQTVAADMPIGRILKMDGLSLPPLPGDNKNGSTHRGTGDALSAG